MKLFVLLCLFFVSLVSCAPTTAVPESTESSSSVEFTLSTESPASSSEFPAALMPTAVASETDLTFTSETPSSSSASLASLEVAETTTTVSATEEIAVAENSVSTEVVENVSTSEATSIVETSSSEPLSSLSSSEASIVEGSTSASTSASTEDQPQTSSSSAAPETSSNPTRLSRSSAEVTTTMATSEVVTSSAAPQSETTQTPSTELSSSESPQSQLMITEIVNSAISNGNPLTTANTEDNLKVFVISSEATTQSPSLISAGSSADPLPVSSSEIDISTVSTTTSAPSATVKHDEE